MTGVPPPPVPPAVAWWVVLLKDVGLPTFFALVLLYSVVVHFPKLLQETVDKAHLGHMSIEQKLQQLDMKLDAILIELRKR